MDRVENTFPHCCSSIVACQESVAYQRALSTEPLLNNGSTCCSIKISENVVSLSSDYKFIRNIASGEEVETEVRKWLGWDSSQKTSMLQVSTHW
jgi:hypothetical protein